MKFAIREIRSDEFPRVSELWMESIEGLLETYPAHMKDTRTFFEGMAQTEFSPEKFRKEDKARFFVAVAESGGGGGGGGGELVGGVSLSKWKGSEDIGKLKHFFTTPACRRQGVGRQLADAMEDVARREFGFREVRLTTSHPLIPAMKFYLRQGYRLVDVAEVVGKDMGKPEAEWDMHCFTLMTFSKKLEDRGG